MPEFALASVVLLLVTAEVPIGLPVLQVKDIKQLFAPEAIEHREDEGVSAPYGAPATDTVTLLNEVPATLLHETV